MKSKRTGKSKRQTYWLRGPFLWASIPLALFGICLIAWGVQERRAADRVQAELVRIRDAGYPVGNASMTRWFAEQTSPEGTQDWNELLRLVHSEADSFGNVARIPYVGGAPVAGRLAPDATWAEEAEVAEYLRWMRPVIEQIHEATEHPAPVWQPIQFQGFSTLLEELQGSRGIIRLLQLEVEHALYHRDADRALRALDSMRGVTDAFDWPFCIVCDLVHIAMRQVHQSTIRRSLAADIWNHDQLRQLTNQLLPPREIAERWRDVIAGERAMMLASITDPRLWADEQSTGWVHQWLFALPSVRERTLDSYREMEGVAVDRFDVLTQRASDLADAWSSEAETPRTLVSLPSRIYELFLPAVESYAMAVEREETSRRFALTALAIKRFQHQEGRWPDDLAQLQQVGLNASDWQTVSGGRFGYEVAEGRAFLWSYHPQKETHVLSTRPAADAGEGGIDVALTEIR